MPALTAVDSEEDVLAAEFAPLGLTHEVVITRADCASGAESKYTLPVVAFQWNARFGFYTAAGGRIALSGIAVFPRSYYSGSVLRVTYPYRLPAGTKAVRAFWWYGTTGDYGPTAWNSKRSNC